MSNLTLTQLEYLVAVADHRHFGKAAYACHVSQPTLSQQVQKVEEDLGLLIFDRTKKPVMLTPEGEAFLEQSRLILREHKRLFEIAKSKTGELEGEFRLAIIPTVAATLIPGFIAHFARKYPKVELYIEELTTEAILESLGRDKLDAGILATPLPQHGFEEVPMYYEPFKLYLSKGHPLLTKKECLKEDLLGEGLWLLRDGHCFKDQVLRYCAIDESSSPHFKNIHFQSGSLDTLRRLVQEGHGYTLIPAFMTTYMTKPEIEAHVRPFRSPEPAREISLVTRRRHWKSGMIEALRKSIAANLPKEAKELKKEKLELLDVC
jgi:LysR family transcriptional regulator, hydrogen peroxide-inducible genes activator